MQSNKRGEEDQEKVQRRFEAALKKALEAEEVHERRVSQVRALTTPLDVGDACVISVGPACILRSLVPGIFVRLIASFTCAQST